MCVSVCECVCVCVCGMCGVCGMCVVCVCMCGFKQIMLLRSQTLLPLPPPPILFSLPKPSLLRSMQS